MDIAREVFAKKRAVMSGLADAGFVLSSGGSDTSDSGSSDGCYIYTERFMDGDLTAVIRVASDGRMTHSVIDTDSGDPYIPMNIEAYTGSYVGQAREEYRALLERLAAKCFDDMPFVCDQANRIASEITARFGAGPENPFKDNESAVFRHKDTGRWFALLMTIKSGKLEQYRGAADPDEPINVLNVKIYPEELEDLLREPGLYRCYHMNKKQWISVALDDECPDDRIIDLLNCSFRLTQGGTSIRKRRGSTMRGFRQNGAEYFDADDERRYWLIPSIPANFDVAKGFRDSGNDTLDWHHRIDVMPGDIVYIYQTEPIASIMWECEVLESYMPRPADWGSFAPNSKYRMTLKRLRSFNKGDYPRSWMNEHGIKKTVRGQRSAPDELVKAMSEGSAD